MASFSDTPVHVTMTRAAASAATDRRMIRDLGLDANGCPVEQWEVDGLPMIVHIDDVPESDITTVHGVRVTSPARTLIDLAPTLLPTQLDALLEDVLGRGLVTVAEVNARLAEPDMVARPGAVLLRKHPALWPPTADAVGL